MSEPEGLLFVYGEPGDNVTHDEFNSWYDDEHAPARMTVPGFRSAARYKALDSEKPSYIALYDLDKLDVLASPEYTSLRPNASAREKELIPQLGMLQRRSYTPISSTPLPENSKAEAAPYLMIVEADFDLSSPEGKKEVDDFYATEHIPMHSKIPGFIRARRWVLESWAEVAQGDKKRDPMKYITEYQINIDPKVYVASKEHQETISTKWMKEVTEKYVVSKRARQYQLWKSFT